MKYDEIINHPHYEPKYHSRMARKMRAAQFAPYAALTGYSDAVRRTAKFVELKSQRQILSDVESEGVDFDSD